MDNSSKGTQRNMDVVTQEKDHVESRRFADLPKLDQTLIHLAMGRKHDLPTLILKDAILSNAIGHVALGFIEALKEVVSLKSNEDAQKEELKLLLKGFGADWLTQWKLAFQMYGDKDANPLKQLDDCRLLAQRQECLRIIKNLQLQIEGCSDEAEKAKLLQEVVSLNKKNQSFSGRTEPGL